jgi:hypothetical protein
MANATQPTAAANDLTPALYYEITDDTTRPDSRARRRGALGRAVEVREAPGGVEGGSFVR